MKKLFAMLLIGILCLTMFAACNEKAPAGSDWDYIKGKGKLVIGITYYEPMNYEENGVLVGFDTEYAKAVAEKLGVEPEFVVIEWDDKWKALSSKRIDCVWNGMTITDEANINASVTNAYILNAQVIVCKTDKKDAYKEAQDLKGLNVAAESASAGYEVGEQAGLTMKEYPTQADAVLAVESGKVEACIIDITMARAMTGEGTSYADLTFTGSLSEEEYGIACRKDSDLTAKINELTEELKKDGTLTALAEKYNQTLA